MDSFLPAVCLPPSDERRFLYTYHGRRAVGIGKDKAHFHPLYIYDGERTRPTVVVGAADTAKDDYLLNLAIKDASCGRPVVWIDNIPRPQILNQLHYWCGIHLKKRVRALIPCVHFDDLSHTWNPFLPGGVSIGSIVENFLSSYQHTRKNGAENDFEMQKEALNLLLRALHGSNLSYHARDAAILFERDDALAQLKGLMEGEGAEFYENFLRFKKRTRNFSQKIQPLADFLGLFQKWTLSSYRPSVQLDEIVQSGSVLYVGLPFQTEKEMVTAVGNIIFRHVKSLISEKETDARQERRAVSVILSGAESFMDPSLGEWIGKTRLSDMMLTCAVDHLAALEELGESFLTELRADTPNIALFNPRDVSTVDWFVEMWRQKHGDVDENSEKDELLDCAWAEKLNNLPPSLCLFETPCCDQRPMLLASPSLPLPPDREDYRYRRVLDNLDEKPSFKACSFLREMPYGYL